MPDSENGPNTTTSNPACRNRKAAASGQLTRPASDGDCPICSPAAVADRRFTDMRRFLTGGVPYWRFLWHKHAGEILGSAD